MLQGSHQDINEYWNIGTQRFQGLLQIGLPNLMVSFFVSLGARGPIQGHTKIQHLLITWGQIEKIVFL